MQTKEQLAIELEHFIKDYIPNHWRESISNVAFVPMITADVYDAINEFRDTYWTNYRMICDKGEITKDLTEFVRKKTNRFHRDLLPVMVEAIYEYFDRKQHGDLEVRQWEQDNVK